MLWVRISIRASCITLCDQVCQWLATGRWFSPGPPVSSTNKTDRHYITEILLKVALNTINQTKPNQTWDHSQRLFSVIVLSGEATNTIVFDLTRSGLESTIYHTRGEHVNHYTTDTVTRLVKLLEGLINSSYSRFKKSWHVDHDEKYDGGICRVSTIFVTGETKIIMWIIAFFLLITSIIKVVCVSIISINTFSIFVNKYLYSLKPLLLHKYIDTYKQT